LKKKGSEKVSEKLNETALGYAIGIVSGAGMLLIGILGSFGIYAGMAKAMGQWHMLFSLSPVGIILGAIEAALMGFIAGYAIAFIYNKFTSQ
jgi:ABC-type antimicrobial peptide transport system permease subunit